MQKQIFLGVIVLGLIFPFPSLAEFANPAQIHSKLELYNVKIKVKKDGTYSRHTTKQYLVLNDEGRNKIGTLNFQYNKFTEKSTVVDSKTINDGKVFKVSKKDIETKELRERNRIGFESTISKVIVFPNVHVGSRVFLEYEVKTSEFPFIDSWSNYFTFEGTVADKVDIEVDSEIPLQFYVADDKFNVEKSADGKKLRFTNRSSINTQLVNEQYYDIMENRNHGILVTTATDWKTFGKAFIKEYEIRAAEKLPSSLEKIVQETASIQDPTQRINQITSRMQKSIRYFGDWARRRGGYIPRKISETVKSEFGDCKDMALALAAMLRKAGYEASVALIKRGNFENINEALYNLPNGSAFNHAITRVQVGEKVFWIDPTNAISFAQGIPLDIADRPAFVLYKTGGSLERTSSYQPEDNIYENDIVMHVSKAEEIKVEGEVKRKGYAAYKLLRAEWKQPAQVLERNLVTSIMGFEDVAGLKFEDYPKTVNIGQDIDRKFTVSLRSFSYLTNEGVAMPLISKKMALLIALRRPSHEGDIVFGEKYIEKTKTIYKDISARNLRDFNCQIESKWIDLQRDAISEKGDIVVTDTAKVKTNVLLKSETGTPEFLDFRDRVTKCYLRRMMIFK